jgi:DNA-binding CsgD family transcriptional regulator
LLTVVDVDRLEKRDAAAVLLRVARRLAPTHVPLAMEAYMQALAASFHAGHLSGNTAMAAVALEARTALPSQQLPAALDLLLDGLVAVFTDGYADGLPLLQQSLRRLEGEKGPRWLLQGCALAWAVWDDAMAYSLATQQRELALAAGAFTFLQQSLLTLAPFSVYAGDFDGATELIEQAAVITNRPFPGHRADGPMMLAAFRGRQAEATELLAATIEDATIRGEGRVIAFAEEMTAVLHNGLGNYRRALAAAQQAVDRSQPGISDRALAELVEAAVRGGERRIAEDALQTLVERTTALGTDWALGVEAYCRALLSEAPVADHLYNTAIDRLSRCSITTALARARLLYGEWLRREGRRMEARQQLRPAMEMFTNMGAEAFAERTERELLATGERLHRRGLESDLQLTAQEAQVCQLARDGLSNPEIAAKLFISHRTVEYHLGKVFRKLGITSRNELRPLVFPEATVNQNL